ncbi:hypothetical protein EVAR_74868_1 [Eumeta japonica]|uniref:Uncharacterized protein n=1 Tax=Eumeta variegata TaxID=151549 RepID=A0A4C1SSG3_EUMVA|nr:hypothetical protein EVAR_74868_1 [Eumeta japonica]
MLGSNKRDSIFGLGGAGTAVDREFRISSIHNYSLYKSAEQRIPIGRKTVTGIHRDPTCSLHQWCHHPLVLVTRQPPARDRNRHATIMRSHHCCPALASVHVDRAGAVAGAGAERRGEFVFTLAARRLRE